MEGAPRGGMPRGGGGGGGPFGNWHLYVVLCLSEIITGRKRERGDWGDASFGNPPPNKIPRPRMGEESLRVLTRSSVGKVFLCLLLFLLPRMLAPSLAKEAPT